jgi:large subunit ribosomal protein L17
MRHRRDHRKLSRTAAHRRALLRNLVTALFQYERIETTVAKAKEARRLGERLITFAKRGDLAARRHVTRFVTRPHVTRKLFEVIAPWYAERAGGYTRILRVGPRLGDAGETAYLELVKTAQQKEQERKEREALEAAKSGKGREARAQKGARSAKGRPEAAPEAEEKPRRGRKREEGPGQAAPAKKKPRRSVTTGS